MAITHTPDTDLSSVRNAMIDRLAWELIGMASDRAQEIIDLANERAYALLRSSDPNTRTAQGEHTSDPSPSSPARVLSLPLVPPAPGLHPAPERDEDTATATAAQPRRSRKADADQQPTPAGTTPEGGRGAVKASVLAHLKTQPGVAMTVNTVAKAVGKAAGSVGAALESLTNTGEVSRVGSAPKTYAWSGQG